ncbi:MAG TPA: RNA polymerase sporulation sigma factor SigK [Clostridia bacterium]|nr:RNA polymerase sporulation sigma factor SigK [Clostridia bacterium]
MLELFLALLSKLFLFTGYVAQGSSFPEPLSAKEEVECLERMAKGDMAARSRLIEHNLRLVAHIAKKYASPRRDNDDLISIGTVGLIKAVSTFDKDKSSTLATYASRCIENEILMSLRAEKKRGCEISLSEPIGSDGDGNDISLSEVLGSDPDQVIHEAEKSIIAAQLERAIEAVLSAREKTVVRYRYGLVGGRCLAQREVAKLLGISRSYVSRLEKKALQKLNGYFERSPDKS